MKPFFKYFRFTLQDVKILRRLRLNRKFFNFKREFLIF
jgi:hypothetical protein